MRVLLFTDTLGDVNGVSRFIVGAAAHARATGRDLRVFTSTRVPIPIAANLVNFTPRWARAMPGYPDLQLVWPPGRAMLAAARAFKPDAVHVSTPGPVGVVGRRIAKRLGVPLVGVYHTDFPAYVSRLFDDAAMTWSAGAAMRWFYKPMARVLVRSEAYAARVEALSVARERIGRLRPGVDLEAFHPKWRVGDHERAGFWSAYVGVDPGAIKVLYVGRVSVEKGLPFLEHVWAGVRARFRSTGTKVQLLIVGDGPYRAAMEAGLAPIGGAAFLGFRSGEELSRLYASSDLFVFPSTTDTLGQVVMEAQASGLPVLVTDQGGPREVVRDGDTGMVLTARDAAAWIDVIVRIATDTARRTVMGAAAHRLVQGFAFADSFESFWGAHKLAVRTSRAATTKEGSQTRRHEARGIEA